MTKEELLAECKRLNIQTHWKMKPETMQQLILERTKMASAEAIEAPSKMKTIMIHKTEGDTGSTHVPVSVNGKTWLIRRGEKVTVPEEVVEVLTNAVRDDWYTDKHRELVKISMQAYPFSIV